MALSNGAVVREVLAGLPYSVGAHMGAKKSMVKIAERSCPKIPSEYPPIPETLAEFEIPDKLRKLSDGENFVLFDSGKPNIL